MGAPRFTPGPWHMAGPVGMATWIQSDDYPNIAAVHGAIHATGQANARLIAAAPELFGALRTLSKENAGCDFDDVSMARVPCGHCARCTARAALKKATES